MGVRRRKIESAKVMEPDVRPRCVVIILETHSLLPVSKITNLSLFYFFVDSTSGGSKLQRHVFELFLVSSGSGVLLKVVLKINLQVQVHTRFFALQIEG